MAKFTFKNHPAPTGLSAVGAGDGCDIKFNKKVCGTITGGSWNSGQGYRISFYIKDATQNCGWKHITSP